MNGSAAVRSREWDSDQFSRGDVPDAEGSVLAGRHQSTSVRAEVDGGNATAVPDSRLPDLLAAGDVPEDHLSGAAAHGEELPVR